MEKRDIQLLDRISPKRYPITYPSTCNSPILMVIQWCCNNSSKIASGKIAWGHERKHLKTLLRAVRAWNPWVGIMRLSHTAESTPGTKVCEPLKSIASSRKCIVFEWWNLSWRVTVLFRSDRLPKTSVVDTKFCRSCAHQQSCLSPLNHYLFHIYDGRLQDQNLLHWYVFIGLHFLFR